MLDEKRIKEVQQNVAQYLQEGLLQKRQANQQAITILVENARNSIQETRNVQTPLWKIVISYYSMFYVANAVLVKLGYKVGDKVAHKVTSDALIVYVKDRLAIELLDSYQTAQSEALAGIKANELVKSFDLERTKRSIFQYTTTKTVMESKAQTSVKRAQEFVAEMMKLL
ncbi:MAG: hypothetical protein ACMXYF_05845 [Candidatus Woesearchaeota archaeon]